MASLAEVRAAVFPAAIELSPPGGEPPDVEWVRVMRARVPAFDALDRGDLVIVPLAALALVAPDEVAASALVDAVVGAHAAALLLVGEDAVAVDPALRGVLASAGIAVYALAGAEPATIERSAIGYLVNRRAELERLTTELERRLEALALGDRGLDALVGELATTLGRGVALEDARGRPAAVHAPPGTDAIASARYVGGMTSPSLRVQLPAGGDSAARGSVVLLGDAPPTELERLALDRVAGVLALAFARDDAVRMARDAARRSDTLPPAGPPWVMVVARQGDTGPPEPAGSAEASDRARAAREALRREVRLLAPARRLALRGNADSLELRVVLAGDEADPGAENLSARLAALVRRPIARSRPFDRPAERALAEADARTTLEVWEQLGRARAGERVGWGPAAAVVLRAELLPAYRLLVGLHNIPDGRRQAEALLAPLGDLRSRRARERIETLRAVLTSAGGAEAATALGVHRNTLAYRVRRIEGLTGWRLGDRELRLALLAAIELVHDDQ